MSEWTWRERQDIAESFSSIAVSMDSIAYLLTKLVGLLEIVKEAGNEPDN
jgi:hypothetical protein